MNWLNCKAAFQMNIFYTSALPIGAGYSQNKQWEGAQVSLRIRCLIVNEQIDACCMNTEFKNWSDMIWKDVGENITGRDQSNESSMSLGWCFQFKHKFLTYCKLDCKLLTVNLTYAARFEDCSTWGECPHCKSTSVWIGRSDVNTLVLNIYIWGCGIKWRGGGRAALVMNLRRN